MMEVWSPADRASRVVFISRSFTTTFVKYAGLTPVKKRETKPEKIALPTGSKIILSGYQGSDLLSFSGFLDIAGDLHVEDQNGQIIVPGQ